MGTPKAPVELNINDKVTNFLIKKKLGEGACGQVFLVSILDKDGKATGKAAMKVEPRMVEKEDEILKMEIYALRRLQKSRHVCRLLGSGCNDNFTYMVMSLLGKELPDIRRKLPGRKMSHNNVLRIGIQLIKALQEVHEAGFIHRDVKPSNVAMGIRNPAVVYLFDFGLARQIMTDDGRGGRKLRDPRTKVMFRGTVRYCSPNVHNHIEQGRHDDLYSVLYSLVECVTGTLPWKLQGRKDAAKIKQNTSDQTLCKGCPGSFLEFAVALRPLTYTDIPNYFIYMQKMKTDLGPKVKMTDPYEWTKAGVVHPDEDLEAPYKESDEKPQKDTVVTTDQPTTRDVDESMMTDDKGDDMKDNDSYDFAREDTLDGL